MDAYDLAIVGAGCAGLSAAIYAARANLKLIIFANTLQEKGGMLSKTTIVENYPGYSDGIDGFELIKEMEKQAVKFGAEIIEEKVELIEKINNEFILTTDYRKVQCRSVLIATGSKPVRLNLPNEDKLWGSGISSCAVCDGALYKNKPVIVVGGGDSACEAALFLTKFTNVTMFLRSDKFKASEIMKNRVLNYKGKNKITIHYNTVISELISDDGLLKGVKTNNGNFPTDGLFYAIGLKPNIVNTNFELKTDENGYILQKNSTETFTEGVFSAGDVSDSKYKQAIVAAGEGCKAALDIINYLQN